MSVFIRGTGLAVAALALLLAPHARATTLLHMNLKDLCTRADKVFRGTVVAVDTGSVRAGGSDLPTVLYRLKVQETFKGATGQTKDDAFVEVRMVGSFKGSEGAGAPRRLTVLRDVPRLEMGRDYVLFTTPPSAVGLSTAVGLGQGVFDIIDSDKEELAVNAFDNLGLSRDMDSSLLPARGPVPYPRLAQAIRAVLSE